VRARRKVDLVNIFGPDLEIVETPDADYRWRIFLEREAFKQIVNSRIDAINYTNFKNSVNDQDLHRMYVELWEQHSNYGATDPATRKADRSSHFAWGADDIVISGKEDGKKKG
jgi:hypothetical protein